jgi:hypothetical protein
MDYMRNNNPNRTDNLKYHYRGYQEGIEIGEIYNDRIVGFVYTFSLKYSTKKEALRYSMTVLKNISLSKRLHHA